MSQLSELKVVGEDLLAIAKKLFDLAGEDKESADKNPEAAVITRLKKVTREANQPTRGDLLARAETVLSSKEALGEIIVKASAKPETVDATKLRIVEAQHNALGASFGRLLEQSAFATIPNLLDDAEIASINDSLDKADQEIAARQKAKDILDVTVDIALTGAKIATRLA